MTLFDFTPAYECNDIRISNHALKRMTERAIYSDYVIFGISKGKIIATYLNDKPFPSVLILCFIKGKPLHIVISREESTGICVLISAYWPDKSIWNEDFTQKMKQ
jgi:hypothetical protein